ncbi:hypothetical protein BDF14DRAFT_1722888 [Spinellus fusiger]|nr:hypothetical protein BDF14DRAFT_1722888 [Spinellus fusiger]
MEEDDDEEKEEALPLSELPPYPPITASVSHSLLPTSAHPLYDKTHPAAYSRQRKPVPRVTRPLSLPPPSASHISTSSSIVPPPLPSSASTLHAIKSDRRSTSTPPDYQDTALQKLWERNRSFVLPREEEGMEVLPDYHCTVSKMGHVNVKREMDAPGVRSRKRGWRKLYLEIWGTLLRVYRASPNGSSSLSPSLWNYKAVSFKQWNKYYYTPIATYSLAGAEATRALDYTKRANSLRFITAHGPQFLLQLPTVSEMSSWVEHLQSAINISLDLEYRPMPKFITVSARAHNVSFLTGRHLTAERARQQYLREQAETLV